MSNSELDFTPPEPFLNRLFVRGYNELNSFVLSSSLILSYLFNQKLFDDIKNADWRQVHQFTTFNTAHVN